MAHFIKKKKEDIGLSPYAVVFRGQQKTEQTRLSVMNLNEVREFDITSVEELKKLKHVKDISWLNVDGLHDTKVMQELSEVFHIPGNIISDIMDPSLRPKVQEFDDYILVTIKMLQFSKSENKLKMENLCLILGDGILISFQEEPGDAFDPVREHIRKQNNKIRTAGSDYLAFALLDIVVDNYIYILGDLGEKVETFEENMTTNPSKELLHQINGMKSEMNFIRKNIKPAKEMIFALAKTESDIMHNENQMHFRELQDNISEATELSDSYREILYDQLNVYHSTMTTKLNDIMRTLTVFSVIFIPLTFIVGVYGTNFENFPEIHWKYGYFMMWGLMIVIAVIMLWYFRRKKWF